jgi:DNA polymerase III subunit epsilon
MSQRMAEKVVTMRCEAHGALTPDSQLIELAAVTVQHGRITRERFHALVNPQTPIPRSGTLAHGHSSASLAGCPIWRDVAASWLSYVQGAHLLVWHADFHVNCLDRAQRRCGLPDMHTVVAGITDLREVLNARPHDAPARLQEVLAAHQISCDPVQDSPAEEAEQLARLWLALSGAEQP